MLFSELLNPDSPAFKVPGFPTTLFPVNEYLTQEMRDQISEHFIEFELSMVPPWRWLQRWHNVIDRHAYQWRKLLDSEQALRDSDAIFNYDLTETASSESEYSNQTTGSSQSDSSAFTSDTPDGSLDDIDRYMSAGGKDHAEGQSSQSGSGTSGATSNLRRTGNIGVMTAAQIIGGYRDAIDYDAYNTIFRELEPLFIGVYPDYAEGGEFYNTMGRLDR